MEYQNIDSSHHEKAPNLPALHSIKLIIFVGKVIIDNNRNIILIRDVAQPGSAPHWGCGGRRFKSGHPDH